MMLKKPSKRALWCSAFPEQVKPIKTPPSHSHGSRKAILKRKPVRKLSKSRARKLLEYMQLLKSLYGQPRQAKCGVVGCHRPMKDNHHSRGRDGRLFLAPEWFVPVCRQHHSLCKDDPTAARALPATNPIGVIIPLLCAKGDWGRFEIPRNNVYSHENATIV